MATKFMEAGSAATGDLSFWETVSGTVTSQTSVVHSSLYAIKCDTGVGAAAFVRKSGIMADAGRRITFYLQYTLGSASGGNWLQVETSGGTVCFGLQSATGGGNTQIISGSTLKTSSTVLNTGQWYRISVAYVLTATNNFTIKVWINGVLDMTATQADGTLTSVSSDRLMLGYSASPGASRLIYLSDIYADDSSALTDVGNVWVVPKLPAANNTGSFDTNVGANPANRYTNTSERPLSETNGWKHAATSDVQENYTLQNQQAGDSDLTTNDTLIARTAWMWAKRGGASSDAALGNSNQAKASGTTMTLGPLTVAVGDLAVVCFGDQVAGASPTIADNLVNSWTALAGPTTNTARMSAWYSSITVAGSMTVTLTFASSANSRAGVLGVFYGVTTSTPLDKNPTNSTASVSSGANFSGPLSTTLAQGDELVVGYFCISDASPTLTAISPNTKVASNGTTGGGAGSNTSVVMTYKVVTVTTSTSGTVSTNDATSRAECAGTATFKLGTPTGVGTPKLMDNGSETAVVLTATSALYTSTTDSATYPSNVAGVGIRSTAAAADTYLYECGTVLAFTKGNDASLPDQIYTRRFNQHLVR